MADDYDHLREYYGDFAHAGTAARRVAWRCDDDQALRAEVLLEAVDRADWPCSVLDVGCGNGFLYGHLQRTGRLTRYVGLDLLPHMIDEAMRRFPEGDFRQLDLLALDSDERFDLVVCSGSLNVRVPKHTRWVQRMLAAMWQRAERAVAVNFQTTRAFQYNPEARHDQDLFHGDRAQLLAWCEPLTPWVAMRQDYLGDDCTFYLYKGYHRTVRTLERAAASDERGPTEAACGAAYLYLERKLPALALSALEGHEETARVANFRGLAHHRLGDHARAAEQYRRALAIDPTFEEAQLNLDWIAKSAR
jgi:SAM-dependent methyltransferase